MKHSCYKANKINLKNKITIKTELRNPYISEWFGWEDSSYGEKKEAKA